MLKESYLKTTKQNIYKLINLYNHLVSGYNLNKI